MRYFTMKTVNLWIIAVAVFFASQSVYAGAPQKLFTLSGHAGAITDVVISPNGRYIATASEDATAIVWNVSDGSQKFKIADFRPGEYVLAVAFSPDSQNIIAGSVHGALVRYNVQTGTQEKKGKTKGIYDLDYSPNGENIIVSYIIEPFDAHIFSAQRLHLIEDFNLDAMFTKVTYSPDGASVLMRDVGNKLSVLDVAGKKLRFTINAGDYKARYAVFSPDGREIAAVYRKYLSYDYHNQVMIWDAQTGMRLRSILSNKNASKLNPAPAGVSAQNYDFSLAGDPTSIAYSADGKTIALGASDGNVYLWDAQTGALQSTLEKGHGKPVKWISFTPDGSKLISGSEAKVVIWSLP